VPVLELCIIRSSLSWCTSIAVGAASRISPLFGHRQHFRLLFLRGFFGTLAITTSYIALLTLPLGTSRARRSPRAPWLCPPSLCASRLCAIQQQQQQVLLLLAPVILYDAFIAETAAGLLSGSSLRGPVAAAWGGQWLVCTDPGPVGQAQLTR
jgi:hypothetical protein